MTPQESYRETIQDTQEENQRGSSQDLIASQPMDDLPSNQEMLTDEPDQADLQEEIDSLGLKTQYLGPSGSSNRRRRRTDPESVVEKQKENFKKKYLELTEILDQAASHLESLANAKSRDRTPPGCGSPPSRWWSVARTKTSNLNGHKPVDRQSFCSSKFC